MNRFRRTPAHRAAPPGTSQPPATQRKLQPPHSASQPGRDNFARRFIQDVAAAATVAIGQNWPAPATANYRQHMMTAAYPLPHTIQVCIHCHHNPAGLWVSRIGSQTVRRLWCLSCCQDLDPDSYHIESFDS